MNYYGYRCTVKGYVPKHIPKRFDCPNINDDPIDWANKLQHLIAYVATNISCSMISGQSGNKISPPNITNIRIVILIGIPITTEEKELASWLSSNLLSAGPEEQLPSMISMPSYILIITFILPSQVQSRVEAIHIMM